MAANFWTLSHCKQLLDPEEVDVVPAADRERGITSEEFFFHAYMSSEKPSPRCFLASSGLAQSITVESLAHDAVEDATDAAADELPFANARPRPFLRSTIENAGGSTQIDSRIDVGYTRRNHKKHKKEQADGETTGANSAIEQHLANKHGCSNQGPSSDEGTSEMPVPDADFYNFGDHPESSFQNDQVWAVYDEDGMPRYYALIRKVLSTHPFKVRLAYLKANDCNEFGASKWISCGYSKTCGEFKARLSQDAGQLNIFSHSVNYEKGPGNVIRIFPKKSDIWALYQNWSCDWNGFTPDDTIYKYKLVEILDSYSPTSGISVMPIEKIPGFVSVFKRVGDTTKILTIAKEEMLRFSHQVPFHVLTGEEAPNAPKGCYELDPASTPKEFLQVVSPSSVAK